MWTFAKDQKEAPSGRSQMAVCDYSQRLISGSVCHSPFLSTDIWESLLFSHFLMEDLCHCPRIKARWTPDAKLVEPPPSNKTNVSLSPNSSFSWKKKMSGIIIGVLFLAHPQPDPSLVISPLRVSGLFPLWRAYRFLLIRSHSNTLPKVLLHILRHTWWGNTTHRPIT